MSKLDQIKALREARYEKARRYERDSVNIVTASGYGRGSKAAGGKSQPNGLGASHEALTHSNWDSEPQNCTPAAHMIGRPRIHASAAAKQRAYRERKVKA